MNAMNRLSTLDPTIERAEETYNRLLSDLAIVQAELDLAETDVLHIPHYLFLEYEELSDKASAMASRWGFDFPYDA